MTLILVHAGAAGERWRQALSAALPELRFELAEGAVEPAQAAALVGWNPPAGLLATLPALQVVFALGAGVDGLLGRADFAPAVRVVRLLDAGMAEQMVEYALIGVLSWQRHLLDYQRQQAQAEWRPLRRRSRAQTRVGLLGLGALGGAVAVELARMGYVLAGWSRSAKALPGVECFTGDDGLNALLARSDVLVNLLPSTPATRGLLDAARLARLPAGAFIVNASRGDQLDAGALLGALDAGQISGALLDVFASEPLPPADPLWRHPKVRITPHVAAITVFEDSLQQVIDNLRRWQRAETLRGEVERSRAY